MSIKQAVSSDLSTIKRISAITISEIYPHYYPKGAVDFFLAHHSEDNLMKDIERNRVFLCLDEYRNTVGTVTIKKNEICRLFVLPSCQGIGYGTEMLDFAEQAIFAQYSKVVLDASLPAKTIYLKRGYKEIEFNSIAVGNQEFLCYDVKEKRFQMEKGRIVIITGSPGTGKTTVASVIAKESSLSRSVHIHTDDFYHYLSKGKIPPYLPESNEQNKVVIEAVLSAAKSFAHNGYDVIVDGIIGPWFIELWQKAAEDGYEVHYIILRADKEETLKRAVGRTKLDADTNTELVEIMWEQFCNLGNYEANVLTTTELSLEETVAGIKEGLENKRYTHRL